MPLAYIQVKSEWLTAHGITQAVAGLDYIINTFGLVTDAANVSRVDLHADFHTALEMDGWPPGAWITRAQRIDRHNLGMHFSGWSIGLGGDMSARLYDKTLEIQKSGKAYLLPLWAAQGWLPDQKVWRLEFEFKRPVLVELGVAKVADMADRLGALWAYATDSWLRLTRPNPGDDNRTRWPNHPLWEALSALPWGEVPAGAAVRARKERVPSDESLYVNGLGGITSFMAREGITDLAEGFGEFLAHAERFHDFKGRARARSFRHYVDAKVAEKGRKFNTLQNHDPEAAGHVQAAAEAYRKERDGDA